MNMEAREVSVFPLGEKNEAYAQYFSGQSYLQMLSTQGVAIANVTFEPGCRNNWHIHHKGGQILLVTGGRGANRRGNSIPATWSISRRKRSTGTEPRPTPGFPTLPWPFPPREPPTNGWKP